MPCGILHGEEFHLLLFTGVKSQPGIENVLQQIRQEYPNLIGIREIILSSETQQLYKKFGIKINGYYLVRPDPGWSLSSANKRKSNRCPDVCDSGPALQKLSRL